MTLQEDYQALHERAAIAEIAPRGQIALSGRDRASYLHGLLTNDIQALQPGSGCYAGWLTAQGRMITDLHVLEAGDMTLLDVPAAQAMDLMQRLDQFIFTEDVQLENLTDALSAVGIHGPHAAAILGNVLAGAVPSTRVGASDLDGWPQYRNARLTFGGAPVVVARIDQLGVPGFTLYVARASEAELRHALEGAGATTINADAVLAARIEAGYPVFGVDMDDSIIPLEAGIESRLISFTKGCYPGQEVIIRVLHRGGGRVVKKLVGLRLDGSSAAPPRSSIEADGKEIGFVTSSAMSPVMGTIAMGYVHRDFIAPGSRVTTDAGPATVSALPFGHSAQAQ
jgi:tRNA-modifying protein YgfZ